ncbi:MAG: DUF4231 domain-containing protein [Pyrinomonadaceae bacterium]|nr:DUF4231 domain-containing protein [Pyrinomonadaceae bacterium]
MDEEAFKKYLKDRYEDQMNWYSKKASINKSRYQILQWSVIILSAIVPVMVALEATDKVPGIWVLTIIVSILLAIGTAGVKTFKFQENWINFRSTAEKLIQEKIFYDGRIGDYGNTDNRESLFVERVEALISGEGATWVSTQKKKEGATA